MARLEMEAGDFDQAQKHCTQLLKLSHDNEDSLLVGSHRVQAFTVQFSSFFHFNWADDGRSAFP